tara:strand:- start:235 stop:777 length:543 start_codon:yes stop_codon:yes gene_type:complete
MKTNELYKALVKFQGIKKDIKRTAINPMFKNKYALLGDILNAIREPLLECGLTVMQIPIDDNYLITRVIHESGEWIESKYKMDPQPDKRGLVGPQQIGSTLTYQKRYALNAILLLDSDEDDDGNAGSQGGKPWLKPNTDNWKKVESYLKANPDKIENLYDKYQISNENRKILDEFCKNNI